MQYRIIFTLCLLALYTLNGLTQDKTLTINETIQWDSTIRHITLYGEKKMPILSFEGATYNPITPGIPLYLHTINVPGAGKIEARLTNAEWETFDPQSKAFIENLPEDIQLSTVIVQDRQRFLGKVQLTPVVRRPNGNIERLRNFTLQLNYERSDRVRPQLRNDEWTRNSVLEVGSIFKIRVNQEGMHKITYDFLKNTVGIDIDNMPVSQIKLYGNGGGVLPESINKFRADDLIENAILIAGGDDGSFDPGDEILFYAPSVHDWNYDTTTGSFQMSRNIYDDYVYFFLKISGEAGSRATTRASLSNTSFTSEHYNDFKRFEEDKVNLLDGYINASGSGKDWYGDHFFVTRAYDYNDYFTFPNLSPEYPVHLRVRFAARRSGTSQSSEIIASVDDNTFSRTVSGVRIADPETTFARTATIQDSFFTNEETLDIRIEYPDVINGTSEGWLDFIEMNATRDLAWEGTQFTFRNKRTMGKGSATYEIANANGNLKVWDVTNPQIPIIQDYSLNGSVISFGAPADTLRAFCLFDPSGNLPQPEFVSAVPNQNIHGLDNLDMVIVYHPDFTSAAERLAQHRRDFSQLDVATVTLDQVYNEFASGKADPTAIRDMARMLHVRSSQFKYLLLFGDGSFDYKNILGLDEPQQFIPSYETNNSLHPIKAFPSDDYFSLLSTGEGDPNLNGAIDIAVGRLPVRNIQEADIIVDKIIHYDTGPATLGDWRNILTFVADDEDSNIHLRDADGIANIMDGKYPVFNQKKIYCDAYQQESTPGGTFIPGVNEAINTSFFKGQLVIGYLGHGGPKGLAHERILTFTDISSWDNPDFLPLMITATCSFTGFDDPKQNTAGERVLLREGGGVAALFSTVRAVFSSSNERLTRAVYNHLFEEVDGSHPPIGEILRLAKNANSFDTSGTTINARKFALFGDPAMHLAIPKYSVSTSKINGQTPNPSMPDTLRALQKVTVEGYVADDQGQVLDDFNGIIIPTVYDKEVTAKTLGQDPGSRPPQSFRVQNSILFKGKASVKNGYFTFSFVLPKDINYTLGRGRISYYAHDGVIEDAAGYTDDFLIGGTDPNAPKDDEGPMVDVFMNDANFVDGGTTNKDPVLFVKLSDDNGINVVGNSIGHDLVAVLDGDTQNSFVLNDFYEAELDDFTKGEVRFPLNDLEPGRHEIKVTAWDVANNSSEGFTEFVVVESEEMVLDHVLNYPNPFTTRTEFMFEHNMADLPLDVQVQIFTISGRLVKTIDHQVEPGGFRVNGIEWDGRDDFGDTLAKGIYVYKIKVGATSSNNTSLDAESDFEKLVILK